MAMVDSSGAFTDDMQDNDPKVEIKSDNNNPERTLRSARRVFVLNLPYELDWFELKDFFKQATNDTSECFVDIFNHPVTRKAMGAGFVEFRSVPEMEAALAMNGQNFKGRRVKIIHDPENEHLTRFANKNGLSFKMDQRYKPKFFEERGGDNRRNDNRRNNDDRNSRNMPPPPAFANHAPPPPPAHHNNPNIVNDPFGRPLIADVENLLATSVFYSNLPWRTNREEIERMFSTCGPIKRLEMLYEDENHEDEKKRGKFRGMGICEFVRARDAQRSLIMVNGSQLGDRTVSVRPARDQRELPHGLSELGRPMPEKDCADRVVQEYNFDPFAKNTVFCMNLSYDVQSDEIRDIFEMIGDVIDCRLIKKDGKSKGTCVLDLTTACDAQQCINVLHDAMFRGRKMVVRFDKTLTQGRNGDGFGAPPPMHQAPPPPNPAGGHFNHPPPAHYNAPPSQAPPPAENKDDQVKALANLLGLNEGTINALKILQEQGGNVADAAAKLNSRPDPPKRENNNSYDNRGGQNNYRSERENRKNQNNGRDRSPVRNNNGYNNQNYQRDNYNNYKQQNSYDNSKSYSNNQSSGYSNNYGYQATKQEAVNNNMGSITGTKTDSAQKDNNSSSGNNQAWNPVTKDTVYVRNLPETMSENRLRSMLSSQGQISFMDFPCKQDNTPVGYAYVRFAGANCLDCCNRTIAQYDNYVVDGAKLEVGLY